jgi:hypothetical protein
MVSQQSVVVILPHQLGKREAIERLKSGLVSVRSSFAAVMSVKEETWTGDRLAFRIVVLAQTVGGTIDVADDHVRVEVQLPWLLAKLTEGAKALIRRQGQLMLEKRND